MCVCLPLFHRCASFVLPPARPAAALIECRLFTARIHHSSLMRKLARPAQMLQMTGPIVPAALAPSYPPRCFLTAPRHYCERWHRYNWGGVHEDRSNRRSMASTVYCQLKKTQTQTNTNKSFWGFFCGLVISAGAWLIPHTLLRAVVMETYLTGRYLLSHRWYPGEKLRRSAACAGGPAAHRGTFNGKINADQ